MLRLRLVCRFIAVVVVAVSGCSELPSRDQQQSEAESNPCHIVYDAGSSGTRLFIYAKQDANWLEHSGPKVAALADPVREIRGKSWKDADAVVAEVVFALDAILKNGPADNDGEPKWKSFDWEKQCRLVSASVYATAGMRLAEYEDRIKSDELWKKLNRALRQRLGRLVEVNTRTLSGHEEGLFAWLSASEKLNSNKFGIVEMGGASSQITFPCSGCGKTAKAVRTVSISGIETRIYSYSFLGLGQDEAPRSLGLPASCAWGVGTSNEDWQKIDCAREIPIKDLHGIHDPYNFEGHSRFIHVDVPIEKADVGKWLLTGAFNYMDKGDIEKCCKNKGACYNRETSCFIAVYVREYLRLLGIPESAKPMPISWTRGAVICARNNCLGNETKPECRWSEKGCLPY